MIPRWLAINFMAGQPYPGRNRALSSPYFRGGGKFGGGGGVGWSAIICLNLIMQQHHHFHLDVLWEGASQKHLKNRQNPKRKVHLNEPLIFRGDLFSFREGTPNGFHSATEGNPWPNRYGSVFHVGLKKLQWMRNPSCEIHFFPMRKDILVGKDGVLTVELVRLSYVISPPFSWQAFYFNRMFGC